MSLLRVLASVLGIAVLAAIVLYLSGILQVEITNADPRPLGTAYDIEALKRRDDVNVLFILTDTVRSHRLSAYGYERETSPTLDYTASTGLRFAKHLAQSSWTKCSMASLWTGLYPQRTGVVRSPHGVPEEAVMPAEIFAEAGFRTAGIWRNGWVAPNFGFDQGFEVYERPVGRPMPPHLRVENPHIKLEGTDVDAIDGAREFLRIHGRDRWFLYLHLMDVHQYLYDSRSALFGSTYSDIYDNSIRRTDNLIGQLLTELAEADLLQKTLVVVVADHGEAFGERGIEGHAREVFRETTEVPFIVGFPFRLDPGLVVETRTRNVDVWPTVLDLLGLPALPDTDGRSLVPEIFAAAAGRTVDDDLVGIAHLERGWGRRDSPERPTVAVTRGDHRFVLQVGEETPRDPTRESLFDAASDPLERENAIEEDPELASELREIADDYLLDSPPAPWGVGPVEVEMDEMEANQLRALGYAVD